MGKSISTKSVYHGKWPHLYMSRSSTWYDYVLAKLHRKDKIMIIICRSNLVLDRTVCRFGSRIRGMVRRGSTFLENSGLSLQVQKMWASFFPATQWKSCWEPATRQRFFWLYRHIFGRLNLPWNKKAWLQAVKLGRLFGVYTHYGF